MPSLWYELWALALLMGRLAARPRAAQDGLPLLADAYVEMTREPLLAAKRMGCGAAGPGALLEAEAPSEVRDAGKAAAV